MFSPHPSIPQSARIQKSKPPSWAEDGSFEQESAFEELGAARYFVLLSCCFRRLRRRPCQVYKGSNKAVLAS